MPAAGSELNPRESQRDLHIGGVASTFQSQRCERDRTDLWRDLLPEPHTSFTIEV